MIIYQLLVASSAMQLSETEIYIVNLTDPKFNVEPEITLEPNMNIVNMNKIRVCEIKSAFSSKFKKK